MKIKRGTAIKLFKSLGYKMAENWDDSRLIAKLKKLPDLIEDGDKLHPKAKPLIEELSVAEDVQIIGGDGSGKKERTETMAKKKKTKKGKKSKGVVDAPKTKKEKKTTKKSSGPKKPGVIASILEFIQEHGPISKEGILKRLAKRFPEREPESMAKTINVQVPSRLNSDKSAGIKKNDKGKYFTKK